MFVVLLAVACSRETPAPPQEVPQTQTDAPPAATAPQPARTSSYADAVTWFRSTPGFHFAIEEGGVRAEGDMVRPTVGAERVSMTVNGEQWTAEAGVRGVVWRRGGTDVPPPDWGSRLYQRVTVAFDPEKREGQAQLVEPGHFRFTDANSGAVHDVWIDEAGRITKMQIGNAVSMTLTARK